MNRENRGASYMDAYDQRGQTFDFKGQSESACRKCVRHALIWSNLILSLMGLAFVAIGAFTLQSSDVALADVFLALVVVAGVLIICLAVFGCVTARTESRCLILTYMVLLGVSLLLEVAVVVLAFDEQYLKSYLRQSWDDLSPKEKEDLEKDLDCCSFDNENRKDCTKEGEGFATTDDPSSCYDEIKETLQDFQFALGSVAVVLIVYLVAMFAMAWVRFKRAGGSDGRRNS